MSNKSNKQPTEKTPEQIKREQQLEMFATIKRMQTVQLNKALTSNPSVLSKFDSKQVATFLQNPAKFQKELRQLSKYLYNVSSQYRQIVRHFATMPKYAYSLNIVEMPAKINQEKIIKDYKKKAQYIDKLNLPHEMSKASKVAWKEDVFYGYEHESKDSYFIQKMDADYCMISSIEDGVFNYAFDFSYFDKNRDSLDTFPEEFQLKYQIYLLNKTTNRWLELDSSKTICLKVNEEITDFCLPPLNTVFEAIFDLDEYKKLKKAKTRMDNFLLLIQEIPMADKDDVDAFKVSLETAMVFHNQLSESLPDGIGAVTSPLPIEAIKLERNKSENDTIAQAQREAYTDGGISQYLFNSDKNTSSGINKSILSDEQIVFDFLRQIERWVNRKLKIQSGNINYQLKFLELTKFNENEVFDRYLKAGQSGLPVKMEIGASLGLTPLEVLNKATLENEIFMLQDKFIPLSSSHTQSGDEAGRPEQKEIADQTEINRDNSGE